MRRRLRGVYLAHPKMQRLGPPDPDGLVKFPHPNSYTRYNPEELSKYFRERYLPDGRYDFASSIMLGHKALPWNYDPSYFWAEETRRKRNERTTEK